MSKTKPNKGVINAMVLKDIFFVLCVSVCMSVLLLTDQCVSRIVTDTITEL